MTILDDHLAAAARQVAQAEAVQAAVTRVQAFCDDLSALGMRCDVSESRSGDIDLRVSLRPMGLLPAPAEVVAPPPSLTVADVTEIEPVVPVAAMDRKSVVSKPKPKSKSVRSVSKGTLADGGYRTGKFTHSEMARIHELLDAGKQNGEIARALLRKPSAVSVKLAHVRRARAAAEQGKSAVVPSVRAAPAVPIVEAVPDAVAAVSKPAPVSASPAPRFDDVVPHADRQLIAVLDHLGNDATWTAQRDLELVSGLIGGLGVDDFVAKWVLQRSAILGRWRDLNTKPGDLDHQQVLVRVLKQRAAV